MTEYLLSALAGLAAGILSSFTYQRLKLGDVRKLSEKIVMQAEKDAVAKKQEALLEIKSEKLEMQKEHELFLHKEKRAREIEEEKLKHKEEKLSSKSIFLEKREAELKQKEALAQEERAALQEKSLELTRALEKCAHLTKEQAKLELLKQLELELAHEKLCYIQKAQQECASEAEALAAKTIVTAINRLASNTVSEVTTSTVPLPSDELKGRIIGKEGRNIRALEKATGASFLLDDTPQTVVVSCFDPVRRAIAKTALTDLVQDGRIHPTRIEEAVEKATKSIEKQILQFGQDAAIRAAAANIHPELAALLGKLKFRYSLGQNVLEHSLEVSHLMGIMARELGLDANLARRIGLLHDVGKAVSHEVQGTHALIGKELCLKYGESALVANGVGCHHNEIEAESPEGSLCSAADAISASRPGARIDAVEEYVQRLYKLEEIASQFEGVERAYALQAGREIRIIVSPEDVQESCLLPLAREITKKIETELVYPGKIKVSLFREKRVIDYAM